MMKRIVFVALMLAVAAAGYCQEVVRYPYTCYMEWPMAMPMDSAYDRHTRFPGDNGERYSWCAFGVTASLSDKVTRAREFYVDTPTTIYGIAMTLWGQDTAQRDFNVMLFTRKGSDGANLVRKMRWRDSLPVRYIEFEASQCGREENIKYKDTATAYEFYFDTPFVATDTFLLGYHTLGVDGQQHQSYQYYDPDSNGYVYRVYVQTTCDNNFPHPYWYSVRYRGGNYQLSLLAGPNHHGDWAGLLPIIQAPCNLDSLRCAAVPDMGIVPLDSSRVEFSWPSEPEQQGYQISVGLRGTPPDAGRIFDVDASPFVLTDVWDTTATYVAYIRARCHHVCHPYDTLVWSEWSVPVHFFGYPGPIGITSPDGETGLFSIIPNPAKDRVKVLCDCGLKGMEVYDAQGQQVLSLTADGNEAEFDISQWAAGSYVVRVRTSQGTASKRLVVNSF